MPRYVDGYVLPVPNDRVDEYQEMATEAGKMWIEHGALEYSMEGQEETRMPFDMERMAYGGFRSLVSYES